MSWLGSAVTLVGRVCLSVIFILSGVNKIFAFSHTTEYMASHGVPMPGLLLVPVIVLELVGGLSVLVGYWTRLGAVLLLVFLVPVTLVMHDFWTIEDAARRQIDMIMFMKNVAIAGGLLYVVRFGAERFSIDATRQPRPGRV